MNLGISGLASGFDWQSFVDQMAQVERAPERRLLAEKNTIQQKNNAYKAIQTQMSALQTKIDALKENSLYTTRTVSSSDTAVATATANSDAAKGTFNFNISKLATSASYQGGLDIGAPLTTDPASLVLSEGHFISAVTAGNFTVNGQQITVATSDTLQSVLDRMSTALGTGGSATYDSVSDKITLASDSNITLGSAGDTSNFLSVAKLHSPVTPSNTVSSSNAVATVSLSDKLIDANLATAIDNTEDKTFSLNGTTITYNAANDTMGDVIDRINGSAAGVTANYDSLNDRLVLTNNRTGNIGISLTNDTGNFLAATKLTTGTLVNGTNLEYTINSGPTLYSESNTISETSSGITGLNVTAIKTGTPSFTISTDTAKIKTAITDFVSEYNKTQALIDNYTTSSTSSSGKVTAGVLANDQDAFELANRLRGLATTTVSGAGVSRLDNLGITTGGYDNNLTITDSTKLDGLIATDLSDVQSFFADETQGFAATFGAYLSNTSGESGFLASLQTNLSKQSTDIDKQVSDMEIIVQMNSQRLTDSFVAMETAQQKINQQLSYLQKNLGT